MVFRVRMDGNMALIQVRDHRFAVGLRQLRRLSDQEGDAGALGLVILLGDIENRRADHLRQMIQDFRQAFGIVLLADVGDIVLLSAFRSGITDIVNIEA